MKRLLTIIFTLLCCTPAGTVSADPVTFGIVPQQSASRLAELWGPIAAYLGEKTGLEVQFRTAPDIPAFEQRLASGEYDIAYMNPYHYTVFHESPGYSAIAKARDKRIKGIIVVRKESPIERLEQLDGEQLAFPAPAAFAASILPRSHLKAIGIEFIPKYVSSHDSVYSSVAKGFFPAGGGVINCGPPWKMKRVDGNKVKANQLFEAKSRGAETCVAPCHNCHGGLEDIIHHYGRYILSVGRLEKEKIGLKKVGFPYSKKIDKILIYAS